MKNIILISSVVFFLSSCQSSDSTDNGNLANGVHSVVVTEVVQANQYTYLHVKEDASEAWLAVPKMEAKTGESYYYKGGLTMNNFVSKDLNRTFEAILFLDKISTTPTITENTETAVPAVPSETEQQTIPQEMNPASLPATNHTVLSEEIVQASQYTYIRCKENNQELWIAVAKMDAKAGKTYYFKGGLPMTDFASKELKRTFKEILFVDLISETPYPAEKVASAPSQSAPLVSKGSKVDVEKKEIAMKHSKEEMTIAKLYENKKIYSEKTIKIKGQVTKFNSGILKRNWIHLQDGTDYNGKFDLAVTTDQEVKVGDNITVEGIIFLDKDFGFGYFYDVILENAKLIQ